MSRKGAAYLLCKSSGEIRPSEIRSSGGQVSEVSSYGGVGGNVLERAPYHSLIAIDVAVLEVDRATIDANSAAILPNKEGAHVWVSSWKFPPNGGRKCLGKGAYPALKSSSEIRRDEIRSSGGQFSEVSSYGGVGGHVRERVRRTFCGRHQARDPAR